MTHNLLAGSFGGDSIAPLDGAVASSSNLCPNENFRAPRKRALESPVKKLHDLNMIKKRRNDSHDSERSSVPKTTMHQRNACLVCAKDSIQVMLGPCGHKCLCSGCALSTGVEVLLCPVCTGTILFTVRTCD